MDPKLTAFLKADPGSDRSHHPCQGGRQGAPLQSQPPVSGTEAVTAFPTVIVGTLQSNRPRHGHEPFGPPPRVACRPATGAVMAGPGIRMILVELRFHHAGRPLQTLAPEGGLQSFEVQGFGRQGTHQGPDFLPDLLRQRSLEPFLTESLSPIADVLWPSSSASFSFRAPRCTRIVDFGGRHPVEFRDPRFADVECSMLNTQISAIRLDCLRAGFSSRGGAVCYLPNNISK